MNTIKAVYENGVFRPTVPVSLPEGCEVSVEPNNQQDGEPTALELAIRRLNSRTPEQIAADRERILARSRPARPLPPGKTWIDMVVGQWPGDETDEEIFEALRKLS